MDAGLNIFEAGLKILAWPGGAALHVDGPLAAGDWAAGGRGPRTLGPGGELQPRHDRQAVHHDHRSEWSRGTNIIALCYTSIL